MALGFLTYLDSIMTNEKEKTNNHNFKAEQLFWQRFEVRHPAAHSTYTILSII